MAELGAIALVGGVIAAVSASDYLHPKKGQNYQDSDVLYRDDVAQMRKTGAVQSVWQANVTKRVTAGAPLNDNHGIASMGAPKNPLHDPLEVLYHEQAEGNQWSRATAMLSLHTQQGKVVPARHVPISKTLTPEIHKPGEPHKRTNNLLWTYIPDYANEAQINEAQANVDKGGHPAVSLRDNYGVAFFTRAPGQSFRYE